MSGRAPRFSRDRPFSFPPLSNFQHRGFSINTHKLSSYFTAFTILLYGSTRGENEKVGPKEKRGEKGGGPGGRHRVREGSTALNEKDDRIDEPMDEPKYRGFFRYRNRRKVPDAAYGESLVL